MQRLSLFIVTILLVSNFTVSAKAETDGGVLENILSKTDAQIIPHAENSMDLFHTVFLPEPQIENPIEKIMNAAMDYYPLNKKIKYEYDYTSTDFPGSKRVIFEFVNYSEKENSVTVNTTIIQGQKSQSLTYTLTLASDGIYSSDSFLEGNRLEMPNSIYRGKAWSAGANNNRISSLNSTVDVPAGHFEKCVRIKTKIGDGDAGSAVRYYAKSIGLLYEEWQAEDKVETLTLLVYEVK